MAKLYKPPNADGLKQVNPARTGKSSSPEAAKWKAKAFELMAESKIGVVLLAGGQGRLFQFVERIPIEHIYPKSS